MADNDSRILPQAGTSPAHDVIESHGEGVDSPAQAEVPASVRADGYVDGGDLSDQAAGPSAPTRLSVSGAFDPMLSLPPHPQREILLEILQEETSLGPDGFPLISEQSFRAFEEKVPHLFGNGQEILEWLDQVAVTPAVSVGRERGPSMGDREQGVTREIGEATNTGSRLPEVTRGRDDSANEVDNAIKVLRQMVLTAAVTAPTDLWIARQILATFQELGLLQHLRIRLAVEPKMYGFNEKMDPKQLERDLEFLYSRGWLEKTLSGYVRAEGVAGNIFDADWTLPDEFHIDWALELTDWFAGKMDGERAERMRRWMTLPVIPATSETLGRESSPGSPPPVPARGGDDKKAWIAGSRAIEIGYHLVPLIIALKKAGLSENLKADLPLPRLSAEALAKEEWERVGERVIPEGLVKIIEEAGLAKNGVVTSYGERVFKNGPGSFGIIHAYHTYLNQHTKLLKAGNERPHVDRGPNIVASANANRDMFRKAISALSAFKTAHPEFKPPVVIEHAVALGVALQEFKSQLGEAGYTFYAADYETTALERLRVAHEADQRQAPDQRKYPEKIRFFQSDIGDPQKLIDHIRSNGHATEGAVMIVGAGFHEIRGRTKDQLVAIFKKYQKAGILLIFVESTDYSNEQLLASGWQTYHAGFRWCHQTSGQGLRSPESWTEIAKEAGYKIEERYTVGKRPIFPYPLPRNENPPLEIAFFAVPEKKETGGAGGGGSSEGQLSRRKRGALRLVSSGSHPVTLTGGVPDSEEVETRARLPRRRDTLVQSARFFVGQTPGATLVRTTVFAGH